ncbi:MAG: hypothetical protein HUJ61_03505 [Bacilli bacterium]|nr:hypothetical protein [Bacilli bacterium]
MAKKYVPSISSNNKLKEEILGRLKEVIYNLEHGKHSAHLKEDKVAEIVKSLQTTAAGFENVVGTGKEDVKALADSALQEIDEVVKQTQQDTVVKLKKACDKLEYTLDKWTAVLNGEGVGTTFTSDSQEKEGRQVKKLNTRLVELDKIIEGFRKNETRLEGEIVNIEAEIAELDDQMAEEENERRINKLFRQINAANNKLNMLNAHKEQYSACFNTLDIIYDNAREIIEESKYSQEDIGKARALLNNDKLKRVMNEPDKAISILKRMEKETQDIKEKTKTLDKKVLGLYAESTDAVGVKANNDALAYKEALLKKRATKEAASKSKNELDSLAKNDVANETSVEVKGE